MMFKTTSILALSLLMVTSISVASESLKHDDSMQELKDDQSRYTELKLATNTLADYCKELAEVLSLDQEGEFKAHYNTCLDLAKEAVESRAAYILKHSF